ncbi:hypothetical protein D9M69_546020 [compost metagenome]
MMASTIITAPSTMIPKSIAPKLIRLPLTPKSRIMAIANSKASGITEATTSPARQFPSSKTNIKMTISAPSIKLVCTVWMALLTNFVRSINGSIETPSGSDFLICSIFSFTLLTTSPLFSPLSIMTMPLTSSPLPSLVTAP